MGTRQTLANLEIQLANNTSGAITPETIRDLLATLAAPFGSIFRLASAPTPIAVAGTYYKVEGTTQPDTGFRDMSAPSAGRLQYDGVVDTQLSINATGSFTVGSNNQTIGLQLAKNGVLLPASVVRRRVGTGTDIGSLSLMADVPMTAGDYIEVFVTNETSTAAVTVEELHLFGQGIAL